MFPKQPGNDEPPKRSVFDAPNLTESIMRKKFAKKDAHANVDNSATITVAPDADAGAEAKIDYLEQISQHDQKTKFFSGKILLLFGICILALFSVAILGIINGGSKVKNASGEALGQQMLNLQTLVDYGGKNGLKDSKTNKVVSEANLVLLSRINRLSELYGSDKKTGFSNPSETIAAQYSIDDETAELDTAKSVSNLDSVYKTTLSEQLADTTSLLQELYNKSSSEDLKTELSQTYIDLTALESRLGEEL